MRFTSMFRYGVRELAVLAESCGEGPVSTGEISARGGIPPSYLEQLLAHLRKRVIIIGFRGPGGAFSLNRPPADISACDIVEALEGPIMVSRCLERGEARGIEICARFAEMSGRSDLREYAA